MNTVAVIVMSKQVQEHKHNSTHFVWPRLHFYLEPHWSQWRGYSCQHVSVIDLVSDITFFSAKDEEESSYPGIIQGQASVHIVQRA